MGYFCPWTSTLTTLGSAISEIQGVELFQHVTDPGLDQIAFLAERRDLGAGALRGRHPALEGFDFRLEAAVVFSGPGLFPLESHDGVHKEFDLLFEPIDGLESGGGRLCLCHVSSVAYLCSAP